MRSLHLMYGWGAARQHEGTIP